ncbi:AbrB/MazE/SpoVT family DNA-binding domain-containing protein [Agrobacterium larrymoorei]|uniref:AbrB/MazE/SpoVT family DNA-binding domain-containing protein n=1 Tax=Agrobacterium larrymoorei TaxID=160699 RepID=UPI001573B11B|nr:AbrB/MazE/SpoVT family DNA-binding domain-containing protein [Agrobacterium larrymoorei]NTJ44021.1 AbrB/MazE/SpoVT family DNA-binding domain-containing protein [Agrobacterium larrymoorei]
MGPVTKQFEGKITREGNCRLLAIPDDFFLEGEKVIIRQERDGTITIHPFEESARKAMSDRFNPFVEWKNGTWPEKLEPPE